MNHNALSDSFVRRVGEVIRPRREFLRLGLAAGATGAILLARATGLAQEGPDGEIERPAVTPSLKNDLSILNVALALEYEAVAAYGVGAKSGLLKGPVLDVAVAFQKDHAAHQSALISTIQKLGGKPVQPPKEFHFEEQLEGVKELADVLAFALTYEAAAASAYLGVISQVFTPALLPAVAGIAANEAQHAAILRYALGKSPCPEAVVQ
jgi:rubrerythrin